MPRRILLAGLLLTLPPWFVLAQDVPDVPPSKDNKQSRPARGSSKLCLNAALYTCWESDEPTDPLTDSSDISQQVERRRVRDDMEIGADHMRHKNYRAAATRYCDALSHLPRNASIMVRVAQALEKMDDRPGAVAFYSRSLEAYPQGILAPEAREGLRRLKSTPLQSVNPGSRSLADRLGCPSEACGTSELPNPR